MVLEAVWRVFLEEALMLNICRPVTMTNSFFSIKCESWWSPCRYGFPGSSVSEKNTCPCNSPVHKVTGGWKIRPYNTFFNKALHWEDDTSLTCLKDKYWNHMQAVLRPFYSCILKTQMNSHYRKWAVQNIVLPGSGLQGVRGFMGFENILMD